VKVREPTSGGRLDGEGIRGAIRFFLSEYLLLYFTFATGHHHRYCGYFSISYNILCFHGQHRKAKGEIKVAGPIKAEI